MRQNYMVAVCDVLGFSRLVETKSLDDVVNGAFGWLRKALHHSVHKREFPAEIPKKDEFLGNDHVGVAWFSDTILLYTLRDDEEAVRQLIQTVGWLLFETMMGGTRIRGGISFGEAYIDEKDTVFIGTPVIEAYRLEQQQQWSGVALTKSACDRIPARVHSGHLGDWWVIPYDVPLKKKQTLRTLAINWTWGVHPLSWEFRWSASAELPTSSDWTSDPDICEKFMNTKAFHDEFCWNCNPK